ncbi:beta-glucuronidase [Kocuria sp. cx-455]|uniref:beta-glucuronidase n=1 Tax=Kocuria sp. cx-455 TaxID=2771377 RepID=UPI001682617D|nr:beta-glucuronidase [Kocuria sp. cx-455]MBD2766082.1 beta-glucuronidase [Kocuria sp. cx-455]
MLRPQNSPTREMVTLDGTWRFAVDWDRTGLTDNWQNGPLTGHLDAPVPGSINDLYHDENIRNHVGYYWYQREVRVPRGWDGERIFVRLESATHEGTVFVNGTKVVEHAGGYTPFEADITDHVTAGETFRLSVAVNNELTNSSIPPGEIIELEDGRHQQEYKHDFYNYAGLHRSVWLCSVPAVRVDDVTVTTDYRGATGAVDYAVSVTGGDDAHVAVRVLDEDGTEVARANGASGTVEIPDVTLWQPGVGYLYDLVVEVSQGSELKDSFTQKVGVRTVAVEGKQFLINGEPFYFTGFGMHEDHETLGKGHSDAHMIQDFQLLEWINANSLRTSHYPYSEDIMDYCDRHGVVVIDETAAVGLNWAIAGGIMGGSAGGTFEPGHVDDSTQTTHRQAIRELVDRDKNRPSVVLWSIANEPDTAAEGARGYFEPLVELTRELDPSRPVGFVNVMFAPAGACTVSDLFDVLMLNRYYGWYVQTGDLRTAEASLEKELRQWDEQYAKPTIMTEYGADTVAGMHSIYDQPFTEDYQVAFLDMYHRVFDRVECMIGEHVWNFADFQTKYGYARVDGNKKGAFTRDRRPKAGARALRQRWAGKLGR